MNGIWETGLITVLSFFILLVLTRLIGKKQLGQLNIFTYITGIVIGNLAGEMIIHRDVDLLEGIFSMVLWSALVYIIELVSLKSVRARILLDGEPTIVIKKGQIDIKALKKQRLNIDDLTMLLRTNKVFSIADVEYAILEPNGDLSVLKKQQKESATKEDMQISIKNVNNIPTSVILDGAIIRGNLEELGLTVDWLMEQMQAQEISGTDDVLYAEVQSDHSIIFQKR